MGGTEEISIEALARRVLALTGSQSGIDYIPYDVAFEKDFEDMQRRVPDIQKIRRCIDFDPRTDLNAIITSVIDYMSPDMTTSR